MKPTEAIAVLKQLINIPSLSREEDKTADYLQHYLEGKGVSVHRSGNNVLAKNHYFDPSKPTILLNSHHDTVKPNAGYTKDPFKAEEESGKLFGLGSNDAGGALVSLLATFLHFYSKKDLTYNLILAATAEEEISGTNGIESILKELGEIELAIVGEPTLMKIATAEKGLLVLDCTAHGTSGHVAHGGGVNAISLAMKDIEWFQNFSFSKTSEKLGPVIMNVTQIDGGTQHNVIPDTCHFVVDIRLTDAYTHEEALDIINEHTTSEVKPRSTRLKPSGVDPSHKILAVTRQLGIETYGSPTMSDQALIPFPSIKMGPGESKRSHTADEFIYTEEISQGIEKYIELLTNYMK